MHGEQAQQLGGRRVDPVQPARDPGAGLIEVRHLRVGELLADPLCEPAQPGLGLGRKARQQPRRHTRAQRIAEHLGGPLDRQVVLHHQIARQPADPSAIARRRARLAGEHPGGDLPAGARSPLGAVLTHPQPHLGQIHHLPNLHPSNRCQRQIPTAALADHRPVHHHLIRLGHLGQVRTRRAGLLAGLAPVTPLPPRRGRLAKPIRRRRPGGVGRILPKAPLQLSDPSLQRGIGLHQFGVGLPQLVDHQRLDRDGGFQIQIGGRDRGLLDNERSRPLAHGQGAQLHQRSSHRQASRSAATWP
jgi:hypothetical protein